MHHAANNLAALSPNASAEQLADALRVLARILAPFIAAEMGVRPANDVDDWIDQRRSPLGRRLHCTAARDGRLTARKVGRRWLVRRADLDAFIATHRQGALGAAARAESEDDDRRLHEVLAEAGMRLCPAPSANRLRKVGR